VFRNFSKKSKKKKKKRKKLKVYENVTAEVKQYNVSGKVEFVFLLVKYWTTAVGKFVFQLL